jgi:hypothetical protein
MCPGGVAFLGEGRGGGALACARARVASARVRGREARARARAMPRAARARAAGRVAREASAGLGAPLPGPPLAPPRVIVKPVQGWRVPVLSDAVVSPRARARARPSPRGAREGVVQVEHRPVRGGHRARAARTRASRASSAARARCPGFLLARRSCEWDSRTRAGPTGPGSGSRARSRAPSSRPPRAAAPSAEFPSRASRPRPVARVRRSAARAEAGGGRGRAEPSTWDEKCTRKRRAIRSVPGRHRRAIRESQIVAAAQSRIFPGAFSPNARNYLRPTQHRRRGPFGCAGFLSTALEGPGLNSRETR